MKSHAVAGVVTLAALIGLTTVSGSGMLQRQSQRPAQTSAVTPRPIRVLLLGDDQERTHSSPAMYAVVAPPLARRGIQITHAGTPAEALSERLADYDVLM